MPPVAYALGMALAQCHVSQLTLAEPRPLTIAAVPVKASALRYVMGVTGFPPGVTDQQTRVPADQGGLPLLSLK